MEPRAEPDTVSRSAKGLPPPHPFSTPLVVAPEGMKIFHDETCVEYSRLGHPDAPARIRRTVSKLTEQRLLNLTWTSPESCDESCLLRAHSPEHLERLTHPPDFDEDTPYFEEIAFYARRSVASGLSAMRAALAGEPTFSLMRPPGHHATRTRAMGFCYLNNAAIVALEALASGLKRVAVFDFDVHHGNGTESILLNQPGASFVSIHQHPCYPDTGTRNVGQNCYNFPVPPHTPRLEYRQILESALDHLRGLRPQLVIVSAGFDAYAGDPLADQCLEREDYHWLGGQFRKCGAPVASLLEGGYSEDLPELIFEYLSGLEGH